MRITIVSRPLDDGTRVLELSRWQHVVVTEADAAIARLELTEYGRRRRKLAAEQAALGDRMTEAGNAILAQRLASEVQTMSDQDLIDTRSALHDCGTRFVADHDNKVDRALRVSLNIVNDELYNRGYRV